ncbi:2,3-diaminopropionate biosynthesis protein SbnB [Catellatospora sp. IY07-71]|uniref:2,3-diaminopropionate biosynthesis protein SbnB n=1 Tax=Catellatospora sp. IY07-71 TaxID=2728827 RepID=UPI001BB3E37E|nr:2,3-diaminopropionate biosynthesis protein SbnB [Catellatospora sp. IY07-71]BCJ73665.1 2,3-diaminopropionate biosynthesis protein SbnB [Catellatospora sp. IY07-71]
MSPTAPPFTVLTGPEVARQIDGARPDCMEAVRAAYLIHDAGQDSLPHSAFLRFPHRPADRVIALPAYLGADADLAGLKWISSFPANTGHGLNRASAVLLLNDATNGYAFACLESSLISAARTAASAVLAAQELVGSRTARRIGFVGAGLIASHVRAFFHELHWSVGGYRVFDLVPDSAERFAGQLAARGAGDVAVSDSAEKLFADCDLIVLATVAGVPHLHDPALLAHHPVVLHLSLRDLAPQVVLAADNFTDDVEHAVRERTSLHLTEQQEGHRDFLTGTLGDLLTGRVRRDPGRAAVFSPFGLGILDLAVGRWVYDRAIAAGAGQSFPDFHPAR